VPRLTGHATSYISDRFAGTTATGTRGTGRGDEGSVRDAPRGARRDEAPKSRFLLPFYGRVIKRVAARVGFRAADGVLHGRSSTRDLIYIEKEWQDPRRGGGKRVRKKAKSESEGTRRGRTEGEQTETRGIYDRRPYVCIDALWASWYQRDRLYNEPYTAVYSAEDLTDVYINALSRSRSMGKLVSVAMCPCAPPPPFNNASISPPFSEKRRSDAAPISLRVNRDDTLGCSILR